MKAWIKRNGALQLDDVPPPDPGTNELLVRVQATSLNRGEIRLVERAAEGVVPGWDFAGVVEQPARDGSGPPAGTRVTSFVRQGAWAELVRVPASRVARVPDAVAMETAATLPIAGMTVMRAFAVAGSLLGKSMLVTGGSGGVGQFAIQLGALAGARVTAVTSRPEAVRALRARNVVPAIDAAEGPFAFILESVGGDSLAAAIARVAPAGVVVTIGNSSEHETTFNARTLYAKGGATIYGLLIFEEVESGRIGGRELQALLSFVEDGTLVSPIEVRRSWTELPVVLAALERGEYAGKAVLTEVLGS